MLLCRHAVVEVLTRTCLEAGTSAGVQHGVLPALRDSWVGLCTQLFRAKGSGLRAAQVSRMRGFRGITFMKNEAGCALSCLWRRTVSWGSLRSVEWKGLSRMVV